MLLLYVLRNAAALTWAALWLWLVSVRRLAQCTSTASLPISDTTPLSSVASEAHVVTLEGLGTPEKPHPLQRAFIEEQAVQCGYCINGMIMESAALLARNRKPSEAEIKEALARQPTPVQSCSHHTRRTARCHYT